MNELPKSEKTKLDIIPIPSGWRFRHTYRKGYIMTYDDLMPEAKRVISTLPSGKYFETNDLFRGVDWDPLSQENKIRFGSDLKEAVKKGKIQGVIFVDTMNNNHSLFMKL